MANNIQVKTIDEKKGIPLRKPFRYLVCIVLCILSLLPFWMLFVNATHSNMDIVGQIRLLPGSNIIDNYKGLMAITSKVGMEDKVNVWHAMLNSFLVTVPTVVLQVYFAAFTAYGVTVYNFRGKKIAWAFIYAIMMIPTQVSIVGFIKVTGLLHMYGTRWPLILPAIAAPTTVYFMKQYMEASFSVEIVEAARIDGADEFYTFNRIAIPLIMPAMATQAIFSFVASWNNLYLPSVILSQAQQKATMPMYVSSLQANDKERDFGLVYMGLSLTVLPIMVAYFVLSKYIVAGVALGGVKE